MPRPPHATTRVRTPKQERSREKVHRLYAAARTCFATLGYAGTTMARIASAAHVSIGTAYAYFKDKDDVLQQVLSDHAESRIEPAEKMVATLPPRATLRSTLALLMSGGAAAQSQQTRMHRVFLERILEDPRLHSIAARFRQRGHDIGVGFIRRFGGPLARKDIEASAQVFLGLLEYCETLGTVYSSAVTRDRAIRVATDMIAAYFER